MRVYIVRYYLRNKGKPYMTLEGWEDSDLYDLDFIPADSKAHAIRLIKQARPEAVITDVQVGVP